MSTSEVVFHANLDVLNGGIVTVQADVNVTIEGNLTIDEFSELKIGISSTSSNPIVLGSCATILGNITIQAYSISSKRFTNGVYNLAL